MINYITANVFQTCIEPFSVDGIWEQFAKSKEEYTKILIDRLLESAIWAVRQLNKQDWLFEIECRDWTFWVVLNEGGRYTLMFPSDY